MNIRYLFATTKSSGLLGRDPQWHVAEMVNEKYRTRTPGSTKGQRRNSWVIAVQ
jgi:hypothetical protein